MTTRPAAVPAASAGAASQLTGTRPVRRVAIIAPSGRALRRLRGGLVASLTREKHRVLCLAPSFEPQDEAELTSVMGATCRSLPPRPAGLRLFRDRAAMTGLAAVLAEWAPHAVLAAGGAELRLVLAASRRAGIKRSVALVNELPAGPLHGLKRALLLADVAVFHNADHVKSLAAAKVLPPDLPYTIVPGAGVDLGRFANEPLPPFGAGLAFLMISRLERPRGVLTYCEAARIVKARAPSARFRLAGTDSDGPAAVSRDRLAGFAGAVDFLGALDDVRPALKDCHVFVYPSQSEGMPPAVLEALATGRPVITTNAAGCRETVDERVNGCLVPPDDIDALAAAMESFLKRPDLIPHHARAARAKAERRFDASAVNTHLMQVLGV